MHRGLRRRQFASWVAAAVLLVALLTGWAAQKVSDAVAVTGEAQARVERAFERQAALASKLEALTGGPAPEVHRLAGVVRGGAGMEARIDASAALNTALGTALASEPLVAQEGDNASRLKLQEELVGIQDQISVEVRRYREGQAWWYATADNPFARLAIRVGLATGPD